MTTELGDLLACPRCDKALDSTDAGYRCTGCEVDYPRIADIPWLFAEPGFTLAEWRQRLDFLKRRLEHDVEQLGRTLEDGADLLPLTRERLDHLRTAVADHRDRLETLLEPLSIAPPRASFATYLALRTRLPPDQGLLTYYPNMHRDWCWGDEENEATLELVSAGFDGTNDSASVLVLGSGAGRLAYDIHARIAPKLTVALDFNPLLQLAARAIVDGDTVTLYEFPLAPRAHGNEAVLRELKAPAPARAGLHIVLGDALRAPFRRDTFDVVVTPWLVDIVPEEFATLARRVNGLLAHGGRWINLGSLAFNEVGPEQQYSPEECALLIERAGFSSPSMREAQLPYLCSPISRHGRREHVLTWCASKSAKTKPPARHEALPDWLVIGTEPVPLLDTFRTQAATTRIYAGLMSLIDGRRSLKDMAKLLVDQRLIGPAEAEPAIREFLTKMYNDSRRAQRL